MASSKDCPKVVEAWNPHTPPAIIPVTSLRSVMHITLITVVWKRDDGGKHYGADVLAAGLGPKSLLWMPTEDGRLVIAAVTPAEVRETELSEMRRYAQR